MKIDRSYWRGVNEEFVRQKETPTESPEKALQSPESGSEWIELFPDDDLPF